MLFGRGFIYSTCTPNEWPSRSIDAAPASVLSQYQCFLDHIRQFSSINAQKSCLLAWLLLLAAADRAILLGLDAQDISIHFSRRPVIVLIGHRNSEFPIFQTYMSVYRRANITAKTRSKLDNASFALMTPDESTDLDNFETFDIVKFGMGEIWCVSETEYPVSSKHCAHRTGIVFMGTVLLAFCRAELGF